MQRADGLRFAGEVARIGDDQRARAGVDQRLGDRERRQPVAARSAGPDLQDGPSRKRGVDAASEGGKRFDGHARLRSGARAR